MDVRKDKNFNLRVRIQNMMGKDLVQNMYSPILNDDNGFNLAGMNSGKEKRDLTISCEMGGCSYIQSFLAQIKEIKKSRPQFGLMVVGLNGTTVNRVTFATWNVRDLEVNSFNDVYDFYTCLDNIEYVCSGPECLQYLTR